MENGAQQVIGHDEFWVILHYERPATNDRAHTPGKCPHCCECQCGSKGETIVEPCKWTWGFGQKCEILIVEMCFCIVVTFCLVLPILDTVVQHVEALLRYGVSVVTMIATVNEYMLIRKGFAIRKKDW